MTNNITELASQMRGLAEAATPGQWESKHHGVFVDGDIRIARVEGTLGKYEPEEDNRNYIAAANPANVITILDALAAAQAEVARLRVIAKEAAEYATKHQTEVLRLQAQLAAALDCGHRPACEECADESLKDRVALAMGKEMLKTQLSAALAAARAHLEKPVQQAQPEPVWSDGTTPLVEGGLISAGKVDRQIRAIMQAQPERAPKVNTLYEELIYAVVRKFPNETRHQTALKYIKHAEELSASTASDAAIKQGGQQ